MRFRRFTWSGLALVLALVGCAQSQDDGLEPVSVAEWQTAPADQKYTRDMLERLKAGNPALQTQEGWDAFSRTTLISARRKDFSRSRR